MEPISWVGPQTNTFLFTVEVAGLKELLVLWQIDGILSEEINSLRLHYPLKLLLIVEWEELVTEVIPEKYMLMPLLPDFLQFPALYTLQLILVYLKSQNSTYVKIVTPPSLEPTYATLFKN